MAPQQKSLLLLKLPWLLLLELLQLLLPATRGLQTAARHRTIHNAAAASALLQHSMHTSPCKLGSPCSTRLQGYLRQQQHHQQQQPR